MSAFSMLTVSSPLRGPVTLSSEDNEVLEKFKGTGIADFDLPIEQVRFLMASGLAYQIAFFMNSTNRGIDLHKLKKADDGSALMNSDGQYISVDAVMKTIKYNEKTEVITSIDNENLEWSYTSPNGLAQRSIFHYDHLLPIEEIGYDEYQSLLTHANGFWSESNPEVDPGVNKDCVLQIVTTNRVHSNDRFMGPIFTAYPEHTTFRLFTSDQKVYSFGLQMQAEEMREIFNENFPFTFAKTTTTNISTPDYEEARPFHLKRATSIPVTAERLNTIIQMIEKHNSEGLTFNFFRQNCATMTREVLKKAGIEINVRVPILEGIQKVLPNLEDVPHVGPTLKMIVTQIQTIYDQVIRVLDIVQSTAQQSLNFVASPVFMAVDSIRFVASKIMAVLSNITLIILSGCERSSRTLPPDPDQDNLDNQNELTSFSKLIRNFSDVFRDDLFTVDLHLSVSDWQLKQNTTCIHNSDGVNRLRYLPNA